MEERENKTNIEEQVIAGAANKRSEKAQSRKGKEVVIHGKYAPMQLAGYDIALIKVDNPFNMSSLNIGTISLSSEEWPQDNQMHVNCKVLGWGRISTNGKSPDVLQHQDVVAKHGTDGCPCVKRFEQKRLVCIEGMVGKGPCMGDSGGPLVCNGKEVGITHMGFNRQKCNPIYHQIPKTTCGDKDTVVTYLYLCPELNWIRKFVPVVPAKPESCSAIVHRRYNLYFITVLEIFVVYVVNIF
ncbi:unnamed protein product [Nezara viridula]|uniref:Peptidase S1 domain-containing protein n=1 Tax=Nezara viridula TaxID=85310 RepID=A0A9P0H0T8_NEZVI|nr:unnamed protein product [Nezara viridula]